MTIISLPAVRKRSFVLRVHYEASELEADIPNVRVTRNGDRRVTRNGDVRVSRNVVTLGSSQILEARKRNFVLPVVVLNV